MALTDAQIAILHTEITTDPESLGYAGKTDPEVADLLNEVGLSGETILQGQIDAAEIQKQVVASEFLALSNGEQNLWLAIISPGAGLVDISDSNIQAQALTIWAAGTTTRANLVALATRSCSRAEKLFEANVSVGHLDVAKAR
jgi:hypothetical protein